MCVRNLTTIKLIIVYYIFGRYIQQLTLNSTKEKGNERDEWVTVVEDPGGRNDGVGNWDRGRRKLEWREGEKEAYISKGKLVKITFSSSGHMGYCGLCVLNPRVKPNLTDLLIFSINALLVLTFWLFSILVPIFYFYYF